jgi:ATP-dependent helicase/nuclease subunit B
MGTQELARKTRVDAWLAEGGAVLAANERAARSLAAAFHATRREEGRTAWPTPSIFSWESWVRERWLERNNAGLMLLSPLQEQALWTRVIRASQTGESLLHPGRLALAAQQAYRLLCGYASNALRPAARLGWQGDAATFSEWMDAFEARCRRESLLSSSRLTLELTRELQSAPSDSAQDTLERSPLLLIGFDRLLETQESLLNAWGKWQQEEPGVAAQSLRFYAAPDAATEVEACIRWLRASLIQNPEARLIVVTTALQERRGELERALLDVPPVDGSELDFEFSLGVPLGRVNLAQSAILLLRWLHEPLSEPEADWLLSSGQSIASAEEEITLAEIMRNLRQRGQERPAWELADFATHHNASNNRPEARFAQRAWPARLLDARARLLALPKRQTPLEWAAIAGNLLDTIGWPGFRPLSSVAFQARQRWDQVLEDCGSLGFDGSQIEWAEFVSTIAEAMSATIFAAESSDPSVLITEPLESAGQLADGIWFLGASEENWPGRGQPHPLLPIGLQRETGMPHSSPLADWDLADQATLRLLGSADEVIFSYPKQSAESETRPSRLVPQRAGEAVNLPRQSETGQSLARRDQTESFEDASQIRFPHGTISGGAATLTRQSRCPFQAFATARLNAEDWEPAETGLNTRQRGGLLHSVLHSVWSGSAKGGISSLAELEALPDLEKFVGSIVRSVMAESFDPNRRNSLPPRFPPRYLELETERLTQLVSEWLEYERERLPFRVTETEAKREVTIAGLTLKLRLDRIDEVQNGGRLVIDYKSGEVGPSAWEGDRPDDVQLPLYATFAVSEDLEGLVFARVRPGKTKFLGRVRDAAATLRLGLSGRDGLVRNPLTSRQLNDWRERIERLGQDFLAGRADVDPKEPGKTCKTCHLHAVCRIYENQPLAAIPDPDRDDIEDSGGAGDA